MKRKYLMVASAVIMAIIGILLSFSPKETFQFIGVTPEPVSTMLFQVMGALYIGFAALNWTAKNILIGGIYAKPVSLGNFAHFFIGALTLIKSVMIAGSPVVILWILTVLYILFTLGFAWVSFTTPDLKRKN